MMIQRAKRFVKEYPSQTVVCSIIFTIFFAAYILSLPLCQKVPMNFLDILFLATSLTTVTGFTTISFHDFTLAGQFLLLILMQIGGLGFMTMSLFIMSLFVNFGLYTQILASEILSIQSFKDAKRILFFIIKFTFICEFIGACATFFVIYKDFPLPQAILYSWFHAISSFCNVGVSSCILDTQTYNHNNLMLITTILLILFGSLGFVTWHEFAKLIKHWNCNQHTHKISWHTRLVLKTFFITMAITAILFWILERHHTLENLSPLQTFLYLCFIGVSTKSCGYLPIAVSLMQPATILLIMIVAFIGAAPSSTGGGIKSSAFLIFLSIIRAILRGRSHAEIDGRTIRTEQVYKAMALIAIACSFIIMTLFCLLITEHTINFLSLLFETVSAFSNNGTSLETTTQLSSLGKIFIMLAMIAGRIGALTLIIGMRKTSDRIDYTYPEEQVILG